MTRFGLYDSARESSACGVGFVARKDGVQHRDVITRGDAALCAIPHRGGMSSEGVGDGAGVSVDLSVEFFSGIVGETLRPGEFGVANLFMPNDQQVWGATRALVRTALADAGLQVLVERRVPVNNGVLSEAAIALQLPIEQWVFRADMSRPAADRAANQALLAIERVAFTDRSFAGLYPLSLSVRTQVLKGRLNAGQVISYFCDLGDPRHSVQAMYFHTRFSTNTEPHPTMAQPFRLMAHNGELNTDRKNRLTDDAQARTRSRDIVRPPGQSDSSRLDQTLQSRVFDNGHDIVEAVVTLMPPAWENDTSLSKPVRDMLEHWSLYEEKNDGPAAVIFSDGDVIGARLDRLGLRPLRTVETDEYLVVSSEAGQVPFPDAEVTHRGRIEAGGMLVLDQRTGIIQRTNEVLEMLAARHDYSALLQAAMVRLSDIDLDGISRGSSTLGYAGDLSLPGRYVAYSLNQESFRFMLDPMLADGAERISAMGYGAAINALSDTEGGMAKYFSQRFAQVTNPPLDSIREADGMSMRVALGAKPDSGARTSQIVVDSPILDHRDMVRLREQSVTPLERFDMLFEPTGDEENNVRSVVRALDTLCRAVEHFAREQGGIAVVTDRATSVTHAPLPLLLAIAAIDQHLIQTGLRQRVSIVAESGQLPSSHHIASALGFGASAVYSLSARLRAEELYPSSTAPASETTETDLAFARFKKAAEKSLAKTMGRVGLCTVESYIGGAFFEPNYLDTRDPMLARCFPHLDSPVGGVGFARIVNGAVDWHARARDVQTDAQIPLLGLFKERSDGQGHSFGVAAVRGFQDMTEEGIVFTQGKMRGEPGIGLLTLHQLGDAFGSGDEVYRGLGFEALSPQQIDGFEPTGGYRQFVQSTMLERERRPSALRDVLSLPADVTGLTTAAEFAHELTRFSLDGNTDVLVRGLRGERDGDRMTLRLTHPNTATRQRHAALAEALQMSFPGEIEVHEVTDDGAVVQGRGAAGTLLNLLREAPPSIDIAGVEPAHEITGRLASGAMSHGALVAAAHESVAHGTNMVGGFSNSGEGGEHFTRYGTIRGSRIKQFASGRFGVWAGYLADPMLEELEIKIGQGAKPGEGGQLPAPKVTVEIAAARGGTPGIELISPPPHHDTYSIEDLAQLIHDCKAARVRVIVKLVSSEGIGTIAVGVAKAGADVINVAGNTGGTGAAAVTSLKYAGRSAEIGVAEVHQALCVNGLRQKVVLRCSGAHQTGRDVVVSALLGGDSFEFGTTALMMLGCVMAKNCNIKCPAGLTTNPEVFAGDARLLAQYLLNIAHDVRSILAWLGLRSLREARGRTDLLQLLDHPASVGKLDVRAMLERVPERIIDDPIYLEKDFAIDDRLLDLVREGIVERRDGGVVATDIELRNSNKTVGGQLSIDIERMLNHELDPVAAAQMPAVLTDDRGRNFLAPGAVRVQTHGSAGQSYGAFTNDGIDLHHSGTANDGVGKGQNGGRIAIVSPGGGSGEPGGNVLIGNFALFGATGGRAFVAGEAGDRFAVRNSGATAVVEGVGDFACEYMTNGAVLNLGAVGRGLGNGMSGGFLYQYDPAGTVGEAVSTDSLLVMPIVEHGYHEDAVRLMLEWHVEATGSPFAAELLVDWARARHDFVLGMPRALLRYQDADEILAGATRQELLDELAQSIASDRLRQFKLDYREHRAVVGGKAPSLGERESPDMFALLSAYTVLSIAQEIALERVPGALGKDDPRVEEGVRNLILTEDFFVMQRVTKLLRRALDAFDEAELATLISAKRLGDYKASLAMRNVLGADAPGTYGWILHQQAKNAGRIDAVRFDEAIATNALDDLVRGIAVPPKEVLGA